MLLFVYYSKLTEGRAKERVEYVGLHTVADDTIFGEISYPLISKSSSLYKITDTHAINVASPHSGMSLTQILLVIPPLACRLHSVYGHASF